MGPQSARAAREDEHGAAVHHVAPHHRPGGKRVLEVAVPRVKHHDRRRPQGHGQTASLRAVAVGAGLWALGHWLFARSRGYYAGALGRRVLRAVPLPGLDSTRGHEQRPVYEYVPRPLVLVLSR